MAMPAVPSAAVQSIALCADAVGVLGPCAANAGFSPAVFRDGEQRGDAV